MKTLKENFETLRFAMEISKSASKSSVPILILCALLNHSAVVVAVWFSAQITAQISSGKSPKEIAVYAAGSVLTVFILSVFTKIAEKVNNNNLNKIVSYEKKIFSEMISKKDYAILENSEFQDLLKSYNVVMNNNGGAIGVYTMFLSNVLDGVFGLIYSLIIIIPTISKILTFDNSNFATSWFAAVLTLLLFILCAVAMIITGDKLSKISASHMDSMYRNYGLFKYWFDFSENYKNAKDIRVYNAESFIEREHQTYLNEHKELSLNEINEVKNYNLLLSVFQALLIGIFYGYIALRTYSGSFTADNVVAIVGIIPVLIPAITQLSSIPMMTTTWAKNISYLKRIKEYDSDRYFGTLPVEKRTDNDYEIEFRNVSFKYSGSDSYALRNVSMKFKVGEHLAFVGANGSGKSTFIKLLCRLYDPTEGEILLNGINIKKYNIQEYMSIFSVVFQDFSLFAVPLSQNVSTSIEYDKEKLWQCLEEAGIADRVKEFDKKEETVLYKKLDDNGVEISGGEAQKIAIARALYRDAPFVVLDEPTAALDPISEFEIYSRFNGFTKGKTAIYISHRLSSCRFCDKIMVFDKGQIVQFGSHDELLSDENGKYYRLWTSQAKYYVSQV